jgi:SAM-dependent methyltransferase
MKSSEAIPIETRYQDTRQAFDSVAGQYSGSLGNNFLVQRMREALWERVAHSTKSGSRLLDLGCGPGLDAIHFAKQGYLVTALDWSPQMVAETRRQAEICGVGSRVTALNLAMQQLDQLAGETFDCIYSDLGALNCVANLGDVARGCARLARPNGQLVFSVIGRWCPWEILYYGLHGNIARVRVRFARGQVPVSLNGGTIWTRYYTPRQFTRAFADQFQLRSCQALNLFLPPPYLVGVYERFPAFFKPLLVLDRCLGRLPLFNLAGDHFLIVLSGHNAANRPTE